MRISDIKIGPRHRRDLGNIDELAANIAEIGLLQPIVVTPDNRLIAGARRLEAAKLLGWTGIHVNVVDLDAIVRGEYAENHFRKDFTPSEAVAIKRELEPLARAAAKKRMVAGKPLEKFSKGRAADKVAAVTGLHRTTLAKAEAVVNAAEAEPGKHSRLVEEMDRTGNVSGVHRELLAAQGDAEPTMPMPATARPRRRRHSKEQVQLEHFGNWVFSVCHRCSIAELPIPKNLTTEKAAKYIDDIKEAITTLQRFVAQLSGHVAATLNKETDNKEIDARTVANAQEATE